MKKGSWTKVCRRIGYCGIRLSQRNFIGTLLRNGTGGNKLKGQEPEFNETEKFTVFQEDIRRNFPDFDILTVKKLGEGLRSIALLVNGEWVFRFPKEREGADDLEKEINILPYLAERITLAVPQFAFVGKQHNGLPFVGYRKLPGEIVGEDAVPSLPKEEKETLARQIAQFMDELSAFPVDKAKALGVPEKDLHQDTVETFEKIKTTVFPIVDENMRQYIASRFESYLGNPEYFQYVPTLIHADLSPDHYLMDPIERKLVGIIDFGDMQICDPDYEYLYLVEDCGEDFARQVMQWRGQEEFERRLDKVSFFLTFDHLDYIMEGIDRGNPDWIREGIENIRQEMKKNR